MKRKAIQLAGKTLVLSLPSKWVKFNKIQKGQDLEVIEQGKALLIESATRDASSSTVIDISGLNASLVWHAISSRYVQGFTEIEVRWKDQQIDDPRSKKQIPASEAVERAVDGLVGMEIIRQTKSAATIREISFMAPEEYPNLMRRTWLTCLSMVEDGALALNNNDPKAFQTAIRTEKNVNRLVLYARRMLHRGVSAENSSPIDESQILQALEGFGDAMSRISPSGSKSLGKLPNISAKLLRSAYECWFAPTKPLMAEVYSFLQEARSLKISKGESLMICCENLVDALAMKL